MSLTNQITVIANILANEGKKPTVALIKSRLPSPAPLNEIISILKSWQHDPSLVQLNEPAINKTIEISPINTELTPEIIQRIVAEQVEPLKKELAEIKQLLIQLTHP